MKYLVTILLVAATFGDLDKIAKVNKIKKEAKEAYLNGNYQVALDKYRYLIDSLQVDDDNITLNLANAYYHTQDTAQAISNYSSLFDSNDKLVRSTAYQQMGVISNRNKKFEESLDYFKQALKADPQNEDARYNYELMKKILKEQEQQQQQNQDQENKDDKQQDQEQQQEQKNQDQQNQDQQNQDQKQNQDQQQQDQNQDGKEGEEKEQEQKGEEEQKEGKEGEEKDKEQQSAEQQKGEESEEKEGDEQMSSISDKLEEMKISEEKAQMILEALKNKEIQYYQQNKRKPSKRKDPNKPDW